MKELHIIMQFSDRRPLFFLKNVALILFVVQLTIRDTDALIHKPTALQSGPSFTATGAWSATNNESMSISCMRQKKSHMPSTSQQHVARQRKQSKKSIKINMAHGNIGTEKFQRKTLSSLPFRRFLLASMLTAAALWKTKARIIFFQYLGWILFNVLYNPYQKSLAKNPLITKIITGAVLAIAGDAVAQATSNEATLANFLTNIRYDKRRALSFAVFDSFYRCFQHNVFPIIMRLGQGNLIKNLLPKIIPSKHIVAFLTPAAAAIEQTALYQFVIVPFLYYPIFFAFTGFIQGLSARQSLNRMKRQFFPCWKRNLMFWIPTQMVLFGAIDEKWQIPFACLMGMLWSMILSKTAGNTKTY